MYLKGSKWSYSKPRRKPVSLWRLSFLVILIAIVIYFNQVVVPVTPPFFIDTPTPTRAPESYISEAENFQNEGKLSQAIASYKQAVQSDPKNATNYIILARLLVWTGKYADAKENAENAIILDPNNSMAHAVRGWSLGFMDEFAEAEVSLNRAMELDPNNAIALAYYAELLILENNANFGSPGIIDKASAASRDALAMDPSAVETHRARGIVYENTANYQEAIQEFVLAKSINDSIADIHLALGRNYRAAGDNIQAIDEFNRAIALNPTDPTPVLYISRTYATIGEFAKALQFAQQAVKLAPSDALTLGNEGSMYYSNRQYHEAVAPLRLALIGGTAEDGKPVTPIAIDYGRPAEYYSRYGLALARTGECGEALQISQLIQTSIPDDEYSMDNALTIIDMCKELAKTGVPKATDTATPES